MSLKPKYSKLSLRLFGVFSCLFFTNNTFGQVFQQMTNILPPDVSTCAVPSAFPTLNAVYPPSITVPAGTVTGSGYSITSIPIDNSPAAGTTVNLTDDAFGGPYPIGFTFNYYGINYTNFFISANGYIGFTSPLPGTYQFDGTLMSDIETLCANNNLPNNAIFGYFQDFNPNGVANAIRYQTTGVAPNRVLTVYFSNLPFFSGCTGTSSFRIKLFETTSAIQIHINNKPVCTGMWPSDDGFSGLAPQCPATANGACPSYTSAGNDVAITNVANQYTPFLAGSTAPITASVSNVTWTGLSGAANSSFTITNTTNTTASPIILGSAGQSPKKFIIKVTYDVPCASDVVYVDTFVIRYVAPPTSLFTATETGDVTSTQICMSETATISYTGNATPPFSAYSFVWDFDGGTANPSTGGAGPFQVSWATAGTKNITLKVIAGTCTSAVTTKQIIVNPTPTSSFTASSTTLCMAPIVPPATSSFSANTTITFTGIVLPAPASAPIYAWNWDGGTVVSGTGVGPYDIKWGSSGTKNITLSVSQNGCTSTITTVSIIVNAAANIDFTFPTTACTNVSTSATANPAIAYSGPVLAGATFAWTFDGGSIISGTGPGAYSINWATPGTKTLTLSVTQNGCLSNTASHTIDVFAPPTSSFSISPSSVCVGANTTLTYNGTASSSATFNWSAGSGTLNPGGTTSIQQVSYPASGNPNVSLTVSENGCISTSSSQTLTINPTPTASFTIPASVCPDVDVLVDYTGTGSSTADYIWTFDGGIATQLGPNNDDSYNVRWASSGNKTISLIVTEFGCASQPLNQIIEIYPIPTSNFSALSPVCENSPSTINYTGSAASTATYNWSFLAGSPANANSQGPHSVTWSTSGTYNLNLTVTENGCVSPPTQVQVVVNPIPTSTFTSSNPVCLNGTGTLLYSGSAPANALFSWDFGGGNSSVTVGPGPIVVDWNSIGSKTLTLNVTSLGCASLTSSMDIEVLGLPDVNAGDDIEVCSGAIIPIGASGDPLYTYQWTPLLGIADPTQSTSTIQLQNNTPNTQTYQFTLTANDGQCSNTDAMLFSVTAPPTVVFNIPPGQCFQGNSFNFEAVGEFTNTANFIWNFGANANIPSSSIQNPSNISFSSTGSQNVSLQVDDSGCFSNLFQSNVQVFEEPTADFEAEITAGCMPLKVNFINTSSIPTSSMSYTWDFGIGNTSSSASPSFNYEAIGIYDVSLLVETPQGCYDTLSMDSLVHVFPVPTSGFTVEKFEATVLESNIAFTSTALNADTAWYVISTGDTLYGFNHNYYFPDSAGVYSILQFVSNQYGCADSTDREINILNGYRIFIPNSFSPNGDEINDYFKPTGEGIISYHITIFNRWGQQVYASYDSENGWDGRNYFDNIITPGSYFYKIDVIDEKNYSQHIEGIVNLLN
jgi:gliding motility-associated-like protein